MLYYLLYYIIYYIMVVYQMFEKLLLNIINNTVLNKHKYYRKTLKFLFCCQKMWLLIFLALQCDYKCGPSRFDSYSKKLNLEYFHFCALVNRQTAALSSATQYTTPQKFDKTWGTMCPNTRFPVPTLLCAKYNVKLKK